MENEFLSDDALNLLREAIEDGDLRGVCHLSERITALLDFVQDSKNAEKLLYRRVIFNGKIG